MTLLVAFAMFVQSISASIVVTLIITLIFIFVVSLYGTVIGLLQVWPRAGRGWSGKGALLVMASAVVLAADVAYGVAWYVSLLDGGD